MAAQPQWCTAPAGGDGFQFFSPPWPGASFAYLETVDAQHENAVETWSGGAEVSVGPGAIVTLTNVELGKIAEDVERA